MDEKSNLTEEMPETIGRYKIHECIGYGAMGRVFKAFDPLIKRTLAIKTIRLDIPRGSPQYKSFIERFYHEARISGTLSHPSIVTLFDIGEESGLPYLAMEFVEGETIAALIEKGTRFKPENVIALASQIASALDYAHSKGIIHRDVKPSNLILFEGDRVKITDFGIAKLVDAEMTQSGTLLGTPSYMSPEQAMGDKLDGRSDIFSLGVCCFEMLSGEQPFPGNNVTSILYKLVHVDPIEPANLEMSGLVPQKWHEVFGKVLAKKPADRYQTAGAFVHDLEYCLGSWFAALGTEDTVAEAAPAMEATATLQTLPAPAAASLASVQEDVTVPMPALAASAEAVPATKGARPPSAPRAAADDSTTVVLNVPAPAALPPKPAAAQAPADDAATVVFKAPPSRTAAKPASTPSPPPRDTSDFATVVLKSVPAASAPKAGAPAKAAAPPVAPPPPARAAPTAAPIQGEPKATGPKAPTPAPLAAEVEATVVLAPPELMATAPAPRPAMPSTRTVPPVPKVSPRRVPEAASTIPASRGLLRAGIPSGLIVGGGALLLMLALAIAGIVVWKKRPAVPAPPPSAAQTPAAATPAPAAASVAPAVPAPGSLHVETLPAGATVTINGEPKGTTPLDLTGLPSGFYEIKIDLKGYETRTQTVSISPEAPRPELSLALARIAAAMGTAEILSTPFGATVSVDGAKVGVTPLSELKVRVGTHRVELSKDGYETWSGPLFVAADQKARLDAQLKPKAAAPPPPSAAATPDPNRIYDNKTEVDQPARKASGDSVRYPEGAPKLKSGESVSVSVSFVVTETGEVVDAKVVESGGKILDDAVLSSYRLWKFTPAVKMGVKVKVRVTLKQTFRAG